MNKTAILEELPRLTVEERQEVRLRLAELDQENWFDDGELSEEQKALVEARASDFERHPETSIPWAVAESSLASRYGK
jgi:hypothetical protein